MKFLLVEAPKIESVESSKDVGTFQPDETMIKMVSA